MLQPVTRIQQQNIYICIEIKARKMQKPELLLPVGNIESFYAAIKGGADAIYLGLKQFNARNRATNFSNPQLLVLLDIALQHHVQVYITLNTVIKNKELADFIDLLHFLSQTKVSAVIIQDWGTFFMIKNFFPKLVVHASTQMGNHNSAGAIYSKKAGFARIILAREITLPELKGIQQNSPLETEVFVHGALCYSFSGMCLFSSYLGGSGANRGMCAQPCRRFYNDASDEKHIFSLKDNELIDYLPEIMQLGIASLKVEGRLKAAEYVYRVAQAYRMVIDNPMQITEAKKLLAFDMGREKTQWFYSNKVAEAITLQPGTGIVLGKIKNISGDWATLETTVPLKPGYRLRARTKNDSEPITFTINKVEKVGENAIRINPIPRGIQVGYLLNLAGTGKFHFANKLGTGNVPDIRSFPKQKNQQIQQQLKFKAKPQNETLFLRINTLEWLPFLNFQYFNNLIIQLSHTEWSQVISLIEPLKENSQHIWLELPQFIPEKDIAFYTSQCQLANEKGFNYFVLSHLSQKVIIPTTAIFATNENVYCYNDAAAQWLLHEKASWITSPFENDWENLLEGTNRQQVIPLYYYPKLFFSRQPVNLEKPIFSDGKNKYRRVIRNGITHILPTKPVALTQYKDKLRNQGFSQFLLDLSFEEPSKATLKRVFTRFKKSEDIQPSTTFNFKKGLK